MADHPPEQVDRVKRISPDLVMPGLRWVHIRDGAGYQCALSRPAGTYPEPKERPWVN